MVHGQYAPRSPAKRPHNIYVGVIGSPACSESQCHLLTKLLPTTIIMKRYAVAIAVRATHKGKHLVVTAHVIFY